VVGRILDVTGSFGAAFGVAAGVQAIALAFGVFLTETGRRVSTPPR
jgi:hypothetical protein